MKNVEFREINDDIMDTSFIEEQSGMPFGLFKKNNKEAVRPEEKYMTGPELLHITPKILALPVDFLG